MPAQIVLRKSGPHRVACLALYRALLDQCLRVAIPVELCNRGPVSPLKHLIRKKFKQNIHLTSPRLAGNALHVGYKVEQLLRNAGDGNQEAHTQIVEAIRDVQCKAAASKALPKPPRKQHHIVPEPFRGAPKVLETRPLPLHKLGGTGRRHVPVYTGGNMIPFLRFKRFQSPFLSRIIKDKIKKRQKRLDSTEQMDEDIMFGKEEDLWEKLIEKVKSEPGTKGERNESPYMTEVGRWSDEAAEIKKNILGRGLKEILKTRKIGLQMLEIAEKEKALWEQERRQRKHHKNVQRLERKKHSVSPGDAF